MSEIARVHECEAGSAAPSRWAVLACVGLLIPSADVLFGHDRGLTLVNAQHITASVFINDDEGGLLQDYEDWLEELAPHEPISHYRHNRTGEDNGDAHLKRQIMGREVVVAVTDGHLDFGPWEQIFYGEFDGRRRKRVLVKIIGE
jgi:secondary thiamine-phosphate synthase enzyme